MWTNFSKRRRRIVAVGRLRGVQEGPGDGRDKDGRLHQLRQELRGEAHVQAAVHQQQGSPLALSRRRNNYKIWSPATSSSSLNIL